MMGFKERTVRPLPEVSLEDLVPSRESDRRTANGDTPGPLEILL